MLGLTKQQKTVVLGSWGDGIFNCYICSGIIAHLGDGGIVSTYFSDNVKIFSGDS